MPPEISFSNAVVLVVHAHPDDEVFATGAATIAAQAAGASVHLRLFTGGEGRGVATRTGDLAAARRQKERRLEESVGMLGIDDWAYLSDPGRWTDTPHDPAGTIAAAGLADLVPPVVEALEALNPDVVLTVGDDGLTGHPDHVACHAAVRGAVDRSRRSVQLLGAVLDERSVRMAYELGQATLGEPLGSGRVTGAVCDDCDDSVVTVVTPNGAEDRRRRALDAYVPGLGTAPHELLDPGFTGTGDSALLRFVLDVAGWERDRFVVLRRE